MFSLLMRVRERENENSKWRQVNKLKRLTKTKVSDGNNIDLPGTQLKKWVMKHKLNDNQCSRQRTNFRCYTRQAAGGEIRHRYGTSMSNAADHQIRATTISGGWNFENSQNNRNRTLTEKRDKN